MVNFRLIETKDDTKTQVKVPNKENKNIIALTLSSHFELIKISKLFHYFICEDDVTETTKKAKKAVETYFETVGMTALQDFKNVIK